MWVLYLEFFNRSKHMEIVAEIFVIPQICHLQFCGHNSLFTLGSVTIYTAEHSILKAKSNFTLLLYMPFLGISEWYFKCV